MVERMEPETVTIGLDRRPHLGEKGADDVVRRRDPGCRFNVEHGAEIVLRPCFGHPRELRFDAHMAKPSFDVVANTDGLHRCHDAAVMRPGAKRVGGVAIGWLRQALHPLRARRAHRSGATDRLVRIEARVWTSDLPMSKRAFAAIQAAKRDGPDQSSPAIHWKGVLSQKDPFTLASYPLAIQEVRPNTVIEIGSLRGGSALWLADLAQLFGLTETTVHSFDVDTQRVQVDDSRITFHYADANDLGTFDATPFESLPHPWFFIEDAHTNLHGVLEYFDRFFSVEDLIVVEDTVTAGVHKDLERFLRERNGQYLVDTHYTDLFGYNVTWHRNGYLRKVRA